MDLPVYDVQIVRDLADLTLFDDLFTTPDYTGATLDDIGYVLHFDGDLTAAQTDEVTDRISHTVGQEAVIRDARAALTALRNQILDPALANTTWTTAQLSSRLRLLGRICEGLVKLELDDMNA